MCKISVIIPVYKVEEYIENSMKSVVNQEFKDFEVILVDNNSPDQSIAIAEKILAQGHVNYKVIKQPKQGLPAARNIGIANASGDWIISIDPDDTISPLFLKELYNCTFQDDIEIVFSKYDEVKSDSLFSFPEEANVGCLKTISASEARDLLLVRKLPLMVSNMFFNKNFFIKTGLHFNEDVILGADLLLLWELLCHLDKIAYLDKVLYNHFLRSDSLMTAPSNIKIESNLNGYKNSCPRIAKLTSNNFASWIYAREVFALLGTLSTYGEYSIFHHNLDKFYNKEIYSILKTFPDNKVVLMNKILRISPKFFFYINKALRNPKSKMHSIVEKIIR